MERDIDRLPRLPQDFDERLGDERGLGDRHARMDAQDLHMLDRGEPRDDIGEPSRADEQRIAAGQDHFENLPMLRNIMKGGVQRFGGKRPALSGPTISRRKQKRQ